MWVLVGASPTAPTSNGQPDVEGFKAGSMGEGLREPQNRGNLWLATATAGVHVEPKESPLITGGDRFPAWLVIKRGKKMLERLRYSLRK
jgi:hypothetical protein